MTMIRNMMGAMGGAYSEDAENAFALMPNPLTPAEKNHLADFIDGMVEDGLWGIGEIQIWALLDPDNAITGLKGQKNATVNLGSPTHVPRFGINCVAASHRMDTELDGTVPGFTQDDAFQGGYVYENDDIASTTSLLRRASTSDFLIRQEPASSRLRYSVNSNTDSIYASESFLADESMYEGVRLGSAQQKLFKNGIEVSSVNVTSVAEIPDTTVVEFSGTVAAVWAGGGTSFNHLKLFQRLQTLLFALRAIPFVILTANSGQWYANATDWFVNNTSYYL